MEQHGDLGLVMPDDDKFSTISKNLSPERPIRSSEFLRGRLQQLENIIRELRHFQAIPFIYGYRGVGKTSLARTAAQMVTPSSREHVYVACAPESRMLQIFREIGERLLALIFQSGKLDTIQKKVEVELSLSPAIRASFEKHAPTLEQFEDANAAVRVLKELDDLLPEAESTVVVLDELEELNGSDRNDLAYLIKQLGDQEFKLKFILVGIAENVHELIGAHESVPRYLMEISLQPLGFQHLMDIVGNAAEKVSVAIPKDILYRIAIIGNGFPHFAHLMGKAILTEAILMGESTVTDNVYLKGVERAVNGSLQELKISYEAATQRGEDYYRHLICALSHSDIVDIRIDQWIDLYEELAKEQGWALVELSKLKTAIQNLKTPPYGRIISNTPDRYGSAEQRYRYKRFSNMLMRGHVRLQAESEGITLGRSPSL